jgi:hypothetical protein
MSRRVRVVLAVAAAVVVLPGVGVAVAEHKGATQSPALATTQWAQANSDQFAQGVTTLLRDAQSVHRSIVARDAAGIVRTNCLYMFTDSEGENTDLLPTPDGQLTDLLSASYQGFVQAAARCDEHTASQAVLRAVDLEVARSVSELIEGVLREEAVTGKSLGIKGVP